MNSDDPKLTAYALDELDPAERAAIEKLLHDDLAARAELEETRAFTARLRSELKAEAAAPLTEAQKAAVLSSASRDREEAPFQADLKIIRPAWWRRRAPVALAASITVLLGGITLMGVRSYLGASAVLRSAGISDPRGWDDASTFDRLAIQIGDRITGSKVAADLGSDDRTKHRQFAASPAVPEESRIQLDVRSKPASEIVRADELPTNDFSKSKALAAGIALATPPPLSFADAGAINTYSGTTTVETRATQGWAKSGNGALVANNSLTISGPTTAMTGGAFLGEVKVGSGTWVSNEGRLAAHPVPTSAKPVSAPAPATSPTSTTVALSTRAAGSKNLDGWKFDAAEKSAAAPPGSPADPAFGNTEAYDAITDNAFLAVRDNPLSTFSIDVDTASYANVRRLLNQQSRPPKGAVRIEEMINYFTYDYPQPDGDAPFSSTMEVATCPWAPEHRLVRVGLKGREIRDDKRPASNLVFLIDVSGSMQPANKLPLLKKSLQLLVDRLSPEDTVAIAVYAGASGTVLEPTHDKRAIRDALDRLESGGSTNGAAGIQLAYRLAEQSMIKGGVNRVILATDGDFNVGTTSQSELVDLIERKAKTGVFLTVLGFGMDNLKDSTLEKLADKGNGNYAYIDTLQEGRKVLVEQMNGTLVTIAKDVKIQVEFNPAQVAAYRLIGYENRLLAKEDFNDDKKDAGEIGAGHTVTALYEVVPAGVKPPGTPAVDALKYQESGVRSQKSEGGAERKTEITAELLTLKLRYKQPDGDTSKLLEFPLIDRGETWEKSTRDFRFAAAVAGFGMLLRESPHRGSVTWESIRELAMEGRGEDRSGYRGEFLTLIDKARALGR